MKKTMILAILLLLVSVADLPAAVQPPDVVTVGTATAAAGTTVNVPVFIRDVSGTPLGIDQPAGSRIQAYGLTVNYAPAASVQSITFTRAGITAPLTPAFESSPSGAGTVSLLDSFQESTNLIPFTSNAPAPGDQVGVLHVTLAANAAVGTPVTLTLDPALTQLSNQAGTVTETVPQANLLLVAGAINVLSGVPALSPLALALLALALGAVAFVALTRG